MCQQGRYSREDSAAFLAASRKLSSKDLGGDAMQLDSLGYYLIKVGPQCRHRPCPVLVAGCCCWCYVI